MSNLVDFRVVRLAQRDPATRFVLEATDYDSEPGLGCFSWTWSIEDREDGGYRPSTAHIAAQLRRIADRYDPPRSKQGRRRIKHRRARAGHRRSR